MMTPDPARSTSRPTTALAEELSVVLADPRRRYALSVLAAASRRRTTFEELAVGVTAFERADEGDLAETPSQEVELTLYHCHLPKLAEAGLIEADYDTDGDVALSEKGRECADVLGVGRHDL